MVKTLPPNDSFHDLLMASTRKSKTMLSILKVWFLTLQMSGLLKRRLSKLHMIIWSPSKQTFSAKKYLVHKPAFNKARYRSSQGGMSTWNIRRNKCPQVTNCKSGRSNLQHDAVYSKTNSVSVNKTRNGVAFTVWLWYVHLSVTKR